MTAIGIRELKAHLSQYLKRVKNGETLSITEHGRLLAMVVPTPKNDTQAALWDLVRQGKLTWSGGKPTGLKNPVPNRGKSLRRLISDDREEGL